MNVEEDLNLHFYCSAWFGSATVGALYLQVRFCDNFPIGDLSQCAILGFFCSTALTSAGWV